MTDWTEVRHESADLTSKVPAKAVGALKALGWALATSKSAKPARKVKADKEEVSAAKPEPINDSEENV